MTEKNSAIIIDDALFMRKLIRDAIESFVSTIYEEESIDSAYENIVRIKPLLITLDLNLDPRYSMQGMMLINRLANAEGVGNIIVISAVDQPRVRQFLQQKGITYILPKPFEKKALQTIAANLAEKIT